MMEVHLLEDTRRVTNVLRMFSRSTCTAEHVQYYHERSLHIQALFTWCFGGVLIPAAPRFFEDINHVQDQSPTLSIPKKEANGSVSVSLVRLFPVALHSAPRILTEEVSNPSFKARHSISTRRSLPLGVITVCCILSYTPLLSVTHAPGSNRAISSGEFTTTLLPTSQTTDIEEQTVHLPDPQWLSSRHTWHFDTLCFFGHSSN